eukprot:scaffold18990_cov69-Phaeocystis_antarctica.AAC.2
MGALASAETAGHMPGAGATKHVGHSAGSRRPEACAHVLLHAEHHLRPLDSLLEPGVGVVVCGDDLMQVVARVPLERDGAEVLRLHAYVQWFQIVRHQHRHIVHLWRAAGRCGADEPCWAAFEGVALQDHVSDGLHAGAEPAHRGHQRVFPLDFWQALDACAYTVQAGLCDVAMLHRPFANGVEGWTGAVSRRRGELTTDNILELAFCARRARLTLCFRRLPYTRCTQ